VSPGTSNKEHHGRYRIGHRAGHSGAAGGQPGLEHLAVHRRRPGIDRRGLGLLGLAPPAWRRVSPASAPGIRAGGGWRDEREAGLGSASFYLSAAREHWPKVGLGQNAGHLFPLVPLDLDLAGLHRSTGAAGALHRLGQLLFFGQTDAYEVFDHRHRLAATPGFHPEDVHPTAMLPRRFGRRRDARWQSIGRGRQTVAGQRGKAPCVAGEAVYIMGKFKPPKSRAGIDTCLLKIIFFKEISQSSKKLSKCT